MFYFVGRCPICDPGQDNPAFPYYVSTYQGNTYFDIECEHGHVFRTIINQTKFEIIFEGAAYAYADGHYREAIMSGATALEEYLRVHTRSLLSGSNKTRPQIEQFEKVVNRAEREYGAFQLARFALGDGVIEDIFQEKLPGMKEKYVSVRNGCTHEGTYPDRETTEAFLYFVYGQIKDLGRKSSNANAPISDRQPVAQDFEDSISTYWLRMNTVVDFERSAVPNLEVDAFLEKITEAARFRNEVRKAVVER
jgi:hypothetical protein